MKWNSFFLVLILGLAACSKADLPAEEITAPPPPTATQSPTATQTSSPTPTEFVTPSKTPEPTATLTPTPTPPPEGYYESPQGFSMILPPGFEFDESSLGMDYFFSLDDEIILTVSCNSSMAGSTGDEILHSMIDLWEEIFGELKEISHEQFEIQDGLNVNWITLETLEFDTPIAFHNIVILFETRPCIFFIAGEDDKLDLYWTGFNRMIKSIDLAPPKILGVDRSQTLVLIGFDPLAKDLDPALQDGSADDYVGHLFSGLVRLNPDLQIEPDLAESWEISPDGKEYTFTLREGLVFQSGKPLTAEDVRYSWERAADPDTGSLTAGSYLGDIVGVTEKLNGDAQQISGVEVIDARTIKVTLDEAKPYFLAKLTYPTSFVVDKENVEEGGKEWTFIPNASGPFGLRNYIEEEGLVFERNENYYAPPDLEYVAYLLEHPGSHLSIFEAGETDITLIGPYDAELVHDSSHPLNQKLQMTTSMCTSMLMLNNLIPPMDDPLVREALVRSIDRDHLNESFFNGMEIPAFTILPPLMPGHSTESSIASFDPAAARSAFENSSYRESMPEIVFTVWGYGDEEDPYTNAIINMWRENLGVEVRVEYIDPDYFTEQIISHDNQIVDYGWCADYPDPENFLDLLFHSQGGFNVSGYSNQSVDILLDRARSEHDPATRISLYQEIEVTLLNDFAVVPIDNSRMYSLVGSNVEGYKLTPLGVPIVHLLSLKPLDHEN